MSKSLLVVCLVAAMVIATLGESAVDSLKAKVNAGEGAAPCDKALPAGPAAPKQFLDIRLPHVVDDYHPPVGGFNPTDIPSKEVDVAARRILREIQAAEAEAKANGDAPAQADPNGVISTEEHKAMKQLLLDADILVRAASKSLAENGPIEAAVVKEVAASAIKKAARIQRKKLKAGKKGGKKAAKAAKKAAKAAAKAAAAAAPAAPAAVGAAAPGAKSAKASVVRVGAAAPAAKSSKAAVPVRA